jgi:hypothetical protein
VLTLGEGYCNFKANTPPSGKKKKKVSTQKVHFEPPQFSQIYHTTPSLTSSRNGKGRCSKRSEGKEAQGYVGLQDLPRVFTQKHTNSEQLLRQSAMLKSSRK